MRKLMIVNSAWLIGDKVLRLGFSLFVWIWLARKVGPELFGVWSFTIALTSLFGVFATLGLDGIVTRELVTDDRAAGNILGTAFVLRVVAGLFASVAAVLTIAWLRPHNELAVVLVGCNATVFVLQSSQVIDYFFQARMRPGPSVIAVDSAFLMSSVARVFILATGRSLYWLGASLVAEAALGAMFLFAAYRTQFDMRVRWSFNVVVARKLLSESWPLMLSGIAVMAYMRLDQVMLAAIVGDAAVGQFSAALRIAEVWYFVPMAIVTAAFPAMMKARARGPAYYQDLIQALYDGMAWFGFAVALTVSLIGPWLISMLYGPNYTLAARVLAIQAWCGVSVAMSFVHGKWLLSEGLQRYGLVYTVAGAAVNLGLNSVLIPRFGAVGAAWSTLCTQVGLLPLQLIFPKARRNFVQMLGVIGAPLRYLRT